MKTVEITFDGHEQANAFMLWLTEEEGLEQFEKSKWAKTANVFKPEIIEDDTDIEEFKIRIS